MKTQKWIFGIVFKICCFPLKCNGTRRHQHFPVHCTVMANQCNLTIIALNLTNWSKHWQSRAKRALASPSDRLWFYQRTALLYCNTKCRLDPWNHCQLTNVHCRILQYVINWHDYRKQRYIQLKENRKILSDWVGLTVLHWTSEVHMAWQTILSCSLDLH